MWRCCRDRNRCCGDSRLLLSESKVSALFVSICNKTELVKVGCRRTEVSSFMKI